MHLPLAYKAGNFLIACATISFSRRALLHTVNNFYSTWNKPTIWKHGVHREIILKWTLKKQDVMAWTRFIWLRIGTGG
jgi:hypothetical protein